MSDKSVLDELQLKREALTSRLSKLKPGTPEYRLTKEELDDWDAKIKKESTKGREGIEL